jgi:hypothetical protein
MPSGRDEEYEQTEPIKTVVCLGSSRLYRYYKYYIEYNEAYGQKQANDGKHQPPDCHRATRD